MLVLRQQVEGLRTVVEPRDDARRHLGAQRRRDDGAIGQVHPAGRRQSAQADVVRQRVDHPAHLGHVEGAVLGAEHRHRHQRGRRHRGGLVDGVRHRQRGPLHRHALVVVFLEEGADGHGCAEPQVDRAADLALGPDVVDGHLDALGLFLRAVHLRRHGPDLVKAVVGDRRGDQVRVGRGAGLERVDQIGEQAEARRTQLARPGSAALDVPLEVELLAQQKAHVLAQGPLVDVVGELPLDQHHPAALGQRTDGPEADVDAAHDVVEGQTLIQQRRPQHQRVEVRPVIGQEDQGIGLVQFAEGGDGLVVDLDAVGAREERPELAPQLHRLLVLGGDHLVEDPVHARPDLGERRVHRLRQLGQITPELRPFRQLLHHEPRHLVFVADDVAFGAVERQARLPRHVRRQGAAGRRLEPATQIAQRRRFPDGHPGVALARTNPAAQTPRR